MSNFQITAVPIIPNFGLIFHDALQLHNSLVSIIMLITTNLIVSMLFSIIAAPLILIIGYRTVAILSGFLLTLGIVGAAMLIGTEYPFTMLMFWYGFVTRRYNVYFCKEVVLTRCGNICILLTQPLASVWVVPSIRCP